MDYIATYTDGSKATTLSHFGIKDMKWGVRRFQNPDGTLTEEGRRRYGVNERKSSQAREKAASYRAKAQLYSYKRDRQDAKFLQTDHVRKKAQKMDRKRGRLEYRAAKLDAKATKIDAKNAKLAEPHPYSESSGRYKLGSKQPLITGNISGNRTMEEKASYINKLYEKAKGDRHAEDAAFDAASTIVQRDMASIANANKIGPSELQKIKDWDIDESHVSKWVAKAFPGINRKVASDVGDYLFEVYSNRVSNMEINEVGGSSGKTDYMISERRSGSSSGKVLAKTVLNPSSGHSYYIDASKNGTNVEVQATKNYKFTIEALDTLGFTNQEIADKLGLSMGQINRALYG